MNTITIARTICLANKTRYISVSGFGSAITCERETNDYMRQFGIDWEAHCKKTALDAMAAYPGSARVVIRTTMEARDGTIRDTDERVLASK